jgi:hypothetical protein
MGVASEIISKCFEKIWDSPRKGKKTDMPPSPRGGHLRSTAVAFGTRSFGWQQYTTCCVHLYAWLSLKAFSISQNSYFLCIINAAILVAAVLNGVSAAFMVNGLHAQEGTFEEMQWWKSVDLVIQGLFVAEYVLKIIAEGFRPHLYYANGWNVFDFFILVVGFLPQGGAVVKGLRVCRVIKLLKTMKVCERNVLL